MTTEERYLEAKKIVDDYEAGILNKALVVKSLPSDDEIHKQSLKVCEIEAGLVQYIAWYYHDLGAKWMKEEVIKRGNGL